MLINIIALLVVALACSALYGLWIMYSAYKKGYFND